MGAEGGHEYFQQPGENFIGETAAKAQNNGTVSHAFGAGNRFKGQNLFGKHLFSRLGAAESKNAPERGEHGEKMRRASGLAGYDLW